MLLALMVAMTEAERLIAENGGMPWRIPSDLRRFKQNTGGTVIMGRKTFESIGKPLSGRKNIVITSSSSAGKSIKNTGALVAHSFEDALEMVKTDTLCQQATFIGGSDVYLRALPVVSTIYITYVAYEANGGEKVFFPEWDMGDWTVMHDDGEYRLHHEKDSHLTRWVSLRRHAA